MTCKKTHIPILLLIVTLLMFTLVGCGDNENNKVIVGKWIPTSAVLKGESVKYSELDLADGYFQFEFFANGSCSATIAGIEYDGSYTFNETSVVATLNGVEERLVYEKLQETLTYNFDNTNSFTFIKETET